jgi:hypothetical protein
LTIPSRLDCCQSTDRLLGCCHYRQTFVAHSNCCCHCRQTLVALTTERLIGCCQYRQTPCSHYGETSDALTTERLQLLAIMRCHNMCTRVPLLWARQHHWIDVRGQTYLVSPCRLQNTSFRMVKLYHRSPNGHPARLPFGYIHSWDTNITHVHSLDTVHSRLTPGISAFIVRRHSLL